MTDQRVEIDKPRRGWVAGAAELLLQRPLIAWDEIYEHAERVLEVAERSTEERSRWVLFSGGNDSIVLLHVLVNQLQWPLDGVVHINTGTGVRDEDDRLITSEFARDVVEGWGLKFIERFPPESFEEVFINQRIIDGLPGPGVHKIAYARLKERAIAAFVREFKRGYWERLILATGVRRDESDRRMGYGGNLVNREGAQMWCNPIYYASNALMAQYRREHKLPVNPVWEHLHMSGECLCGCFAAPGELDQISFFYPRTGEMIRGWEQAAKEAGCRYWMWGTERDDHALIRQALDEGRITEADIWPASDLCGSCETRRLAMTKAMGIIPLFEEEPDG